MTRPFFSASSREDLRSILDYIAQDNPGAALGHVERLEQACWMLAIIPNWGPRVKICSLIFAHGPSVNM